MKGASIHERLASKKGLPEALLALSVLSVSPPWIKYIASAVEHGGGEIRLILSVLAALVPAILFVMAFIHRRLPSGKSSKLARWLEKESAEEIYLPTLAVVFGIQTTLTILAWLDVQDLELTGMFLRFYMFLIPFNSIAVFVFTLLFALADPKTWIRPVEIVLALLLVVFSILALGEVSSLLST